SHASNCSLDLRDLHSFPTRRSSDLFEVLLAQPAVGELVAGLLPRGELLSDPKMLYIGIGIVGATIMPHNLYLHSSIVQTRRYDTDRKSTRLNSSHVAISYAVFCLKK